jgi:hypothetical protein
MKRRVVPGTREAIAQFSKSSIRVARSPGPPIAQLPWIAPIARVTWGDATCAGVRWTESVRERDQNDQRGRGGAAAVRDQNDQRNAAARWREME